MVMGRNRQKGSVTVFLSLTCVLFLSLICTVIESARIQGAKAQTANILGMGNVSLLSEFEKELLEQYELFALDGAYGTGEFQKENIEKRLKTFLLQNTSPKKEGLSTWCFDPWNLELTNTKVESYGLLTDQKGEAFYQQVVSFMKQNAGLFAMEKLMSYGESAEEIQDYEASYKEIQKKNQGILEQLESEKQQKTEQLEAQAKETEESLDGAEGGLAVPEEPKVNPLTEMAKVRKKSMLELVTGGTEISAKSIAVKKLPSKGNIRKGTLTIEKEHSGILANTLFREYLVEYFSNYLDHKEDDVLHYQVEYILGGKKSDKDNLKYVVNKLLLIREGMNYLYCASDLQFQSKANAMAAALVGFLGIPALTAATGQAILLAWAYGESLLDMRILLKGGKVPLQKKEGQWQLSLENMGNLMEILQEGNSKITEGMTYQEYLRILLYMGNLGNQKMRGIDLIQLNLQKIEGLSEFLADNCVVAVKTSAKWNCKSVFLGLPKVVMGVQKNGMTFEQEGSIAY